MKCWRRKADLSQARFCGAFAVQSLSRQDHIQSRRKPNFSGQTHAATHAWNKAQLHLRKADSGRRVLRHHNGGTRQRKLTPPSESSPLNGDHRRKREIFPGVDHFLTISRQITRFFFGICGSDHLNVRPRDKNPGLAREHYQRFDLPVRMKFLEPRQKLTKLVDCLTTKLIHLFAGKIERHAPDLGRKAIGKVFEAKRGRSCRLAHVNLPVLSSLKKKRWPLNLSQATTSKTQSSGSKTVRR